MSLHPGMGCPPFKEMGRTLAVGKINFVLGKFKALNVEAQPSAVSPNPCMKISTFEYVPEEGIEVIARPPVPSMYWFVY